MWSSECFVWFFFTFFCGIKKLLKQYPVVLQLPLISVSVSSRLVLGKARCEPGIQTVSFTANNFCWKKKLDYLTGMRDVICHHAVIFLNFESQEMLRTFPHSSLKVFTCISVAWKKAIAEWWDGNGPLEII